MPSLKLEMTRKLASLLLLSVMFFSLTFVTPVHADTIVRGDECPTSGILLFPAWYRGLYFEEDIMKEDGTIVPGPCGVHLDDLNDVWLIVFNAFEIFIQLCGYVAVGYIIWGGFKYIKSQGNPNDISSARGTIVNAAIGLVVALSAVAIIRFVSGLF